MALRRVQAYRNLNIRDHVAYSIRDAKTGLVIAHAPAVLLEDVQLRVQPAGRERVLREKRKAVHAYVVGGWHRRGGEVAGDWVPIRYNPYKFETFVRADDLSPVYEAEFVALTKDGAFAILEDGPRTRRNPTSPLIEPPPRDEVNLWNG
jgi:hypothetical protein